MSSIKKPLNLTNMVLLPCTSQDEGWKHSRKGTIIYFSTWNPFWFFRQRSEAQSETQELLTTAGAAACHEPEHVRQFPRPAGCSGGWIYTLGTVHREQEGKNNSLRTAAYKTLAIQPQETEFGGKPEVDKLPESGSLLTSETSCYILL